METMKKKEEKYVLGEKKRGTHTCLQTHTHTHTHSDFCGRMLQGHKVSTNVSTNTQNTHTHTYTHTHTQIHCVERLALQPTNHKPNFFLLPLFSLSLSLSFSLSLSLTHSLCLSHASALPALFL